MHLVVAALLGLAAGAAFAFMCALLVGLGYGDPWADLLEDDDDTPGPTRPGTSWRQRRDLEAEEADRRERVELETAELPDHHHPREGNP